LDSKRWFEGISRAKASGLGKEKHSQSRTLLLKNQEADHEEKRRVQNFISENARQSHRSQAKNAYA
jgi:hypothetical protein